MAETRRKFDQDFKEGAVRLVRETGKPIAQVAKDLGINEGTLGNWVNADRRRRGDGTELGEDERAELARRWPARRCPDRSSGCAAAGSAPACGPAGSASRCGAWPRLSWS